MKPMSAYWASIGRNWLIVLVCALAGGAGGLAYSTLVPASYTSTGQVVVNVESLGTTSDRLSGATYVQSMMPTYVAAVTSSTILDPVIEQLGLQETTDELRKSIDVTADRGTSLISIAASSDSPEAAQELTTAIATTFAQLAPTLLSPNGEAPPAPDPETTIPTPPNSQTVPATVSVSVTDAATLPDTTDAPPTALTVALGAASGLVVGLVIALLLGSFDSRIRTIADLEALIDAPVLARLPKIRRSRWAARGKDPEWTDAIRSLRTAVFSWGADSTSLQFMPAVLGSGASGTAADLARALAHIKANVTVVDADLNNPSLSREFGLDPSPGLTEVLDNTAELERAAASDPGFPTLRVLPPGTSGGAADVLSGDALPHLMNELVSRSSLVIVDTPPLTSSSDSVAVARATSRVVIVVALGAVSAGALRHQVNAVEAATGRRPDIVASRVSARALTTSGPRSIS